MLVFHTGGAGGWGEEDGSKEEGGQLNWFHVHV
jgi:hypothetical protein